MVTRESRAFRRRWVSISYLICGSVALTNLYYRYCASPFSGMGTTLALAGAYHLAGSLVNNLSSHSRAFEAYEEAMHPLVANAQKLPPAMPHLIHPQSTWGVWVLRILVAAIYWSGVGTLLFKWKGPPASVVKLKEYGLLAEKGE